MTYLVLFFTHSGAIKFNRKMAKMTIKSEMMPVPRALSSNCSIAAQIDYEGNIEELIDSEVEKIFKVEDGDYILLYETID